MLLKVSQATFYALFPFKYEEVKADSQGDSPNRSPPILRQGTSLVAGQGECVSLRNVLLR
jgi:hypothetical protein